MGQIKSIEVKPAFPVGCRVQMFDRFRLASHDVYGTVRDLSTSNDGVAVEVDEKHHFLLAPDARGELQWFRPQQLVRLQNATEILQECTGLNFGDMIAGIKRGKSFARMGWNGKGIYITGQFPDEHSKMTQPYIYMTTLDLMTDNPAAVRGVVPWLASQTDMLAEDWVEM